jgi:hypothetical protein
MAYDGFGQRLTGLGEKEKAVPTLARAVEEGQTLDEKERSTAAEHLERA